MCKIGILNNLLIVYLFNMFYAYSLINPKHSKT